MIDWPLAFFISDWAIRLIMLPVIVSRKRNCTAALAWMLIVSFVPWIGTVLYFFIGEIRLGKRRLKRYARNADVSLVARRTAAIASAIVRPELSGSGRSISNVAEHLGSMPIVGGNSVEYILDSTKFVDELVAEIDKAKSHAHLMFYIIRPDETGTRVTDALVRAAARGVECRLLADAAGSSDFLGKPADVLRSRGVRVVSNFPVGIFRQRLHRMDLRNHRKLAVVDGQVAFTGSQNLVNSDYGHKHYGAWQDLSLRLVGPTVGYLQAVFAEDWDYETSEDLDKPTYFPDIVGALPGDVAMQVVPSGPHTKDGSVVRDILLEALHSARQRVIITTPYFVPDEATMTAIRLAALRGAQVDLVLPKRTDSIIADLIARSHMGALMAAGVRIHAHHVGLLHAKTMSVDDGLAFVGSANFDVRSFFLNFELSVLMYGSDATARLRACQRKALNESTLVSHKEYADRSWSACFKEDLACLASPLM